MSPWLHVLQMKVISLVLSTLWRPAIKTTHTHSCISGLLSQCSSSLGHVPPNRTFKSTWEQIFNTLDARSVANPTVLQHSREVKALTTTRKSHPRHWSFAIHQLLGKGTLYIYFSSPMPVSLTPGDSGNQPQSAGWLILVSVLVRWMTHIGASVSHCWSAGCLTRVSMWVTAGWLTLVSGWVTAGWLTWVTVWVTAGQMDDSHCSQCESLLDDSHGSQCESLLDDTQVTLWVTAGWLTRVTVWVTAGQMDDSPRWMTHTGLNVSHCRMTHTGDSVSHCWSAGWLTRVNQTRLTTTEHITNLREHCTWRQTHWHRLSTATTSVCRRSHNRARRRRHSDQHRLAAYVCLLRVTAAETTDPLQTQTQNVHRRLCRPFVITC